MTSTEADLTAVLLDARRRGFLGPGPVAQHVHHARGFVSAAEAALGRTPSTYVDLGTGGGIPGLVLAFAWPGAHGTFIDAAARRCEALRTWIERLDLTSRVTVVEGRAEEIAHDPHWRERAEVVTARAFAAPGPTAEIGTGFVQVGGVLVVSDPPAADEGRWPPAPLAELGLTAEAADSAAGHFQVLRKRSPAPGRFPRASGRPAKRPLW
jgi:16S rRNA (guanine527-N7)-methyltransferase